MAFQAIKLPVRAYFLVYSLTLLSCENDPEQVDAIFRKKTAVEEAYQVESYLSQGGKVRARLTAPYMKRYVVDSPYIEFSKTLHVDFFQDSQLVESTLDALFARHMEFQRKAWIRDSVVVINKWKGDTLRTNELWWDQNAEEFYTDKPVWIYQRTGYTYGKNGMRAKQDFSEWWILASSGSRQVSDTGFIQ